MLPLPPAPAAPISVTSPEPAVAVSGETEEGKGERASRISLHLRQSSRNRSASPTSHRYKMTGLPLPVPSAIWGQPSATRPKTPELLPPVPKLHSPRPMLSPKASFTGEALASPGQSGRVAALEKMVEEAERKKSEDHVASHAEPEMTLGVSPMELEAKELNDLLDKTLPLPPVPSAKPKTNVSTSSPLLDMFNQRAQAAENSTPEKEPKAPRPVFVMANLPPNRARQSLPESSPHKSVGSDDAQINQDKSSPPMEIRPKPSPIGLDALENRLIKEVGTRKPSAAAVQHLRELEDATTVAIKAKAEEKRKLSVEPHVKPTDGSIGATVTPSEDKEAAIHVLLNRKRRKTFDAEISAQDSNDRKSQNGLTHQEEEALRLRKAAKARVAGWLGNAQEADPPPLSETRIIEQAAKEPPPPEVADKQAAEEKPETAESRPPSTEGLPSRKESVDPSKIQLPGRTSSGFVPVSRMPVKALPRITEIESAESPILARYKPSQPTKVANYDVRSARGGRGGKVTSVAALWAEKVSQDAGSPPPLSPKLPRDAVPLPVMVRLGDERIKLPNPPVVKSIKSQVEKVKTPPQEVAPAPARSYPWFGAALSPARSTPANLTKGVSVPAKLSSSIASPTLSSTESLARPQPAKAVHPVRSPVVQTTLPTVDMVGNKVVRPELTPSTSAPGLSAQVVSFGQARLKGLIAKYQGGA